jgi:simple sugar transport system substrate-binding protein
MNRKRISWLFLILLIAAAMLAACQPAATGTSDEGGDDTGGDGGEATAEEEFVYGVILVGPKNDHGWSQAHFEATEYVKEHIPNSRAIIFESLNPGDKPETTLEGVVDTMVADGASVIFATSDAFEEDTLKAAEKYPDVKFVMVSGDDAWADGNDAGKAPANLSNIMGRMENMKAIAGCAAALSTQTGGIHYMGPLINFETRRLAASAYLGARHCWQEYRGEDPADLKFSVTWIGFWFNIPGTTLDPTEVVNTAFDSGDDVVISGIDTTEAIIVSGQRGAEGDAVMAIPYDFAGACTEAPDVCLGVPYFNWGPSYLDKVMQASEGSWQSTFEWLDANWEDLNDPDTSHVGWVNGDGLSEEAAADLEDFISKLASGDVNVWTGPINLQDGSEYVADGETATDQQIWYLPMLLEGMEGQSE